MQAQNKPTISMDIAALLSDSPVQIVSTKSTSMYMFDSVEVINRSDRTISSITFALSFEERQSTKHNQFSIRLKPRPTRLESKSKTTLDAIGYRGKELMDICASAKMGTVMATIGVVEVEFTEGDRWRYEIENEHRHKFPSHDSLKARARFFNDSRVDLLLAESCRNKEDLALRTAGYAAQSEQHRLLPVFQGGGYFSCADAGSTSCILCTNTGAVVQFRYAKTPKEVVAADSLAFAFWHLLSMP